MALPTSALKVQIKNAFLDQRSNTDNPEAAAEDLANKICNALEDWVKQLTITYTTGLASPSGLVTGDFNYNLS